MIPQSQGPLRRVPTLTIRLLLPLAALTLLLRLPLLPALAGAGLALASFLALGPTLAPFFGNPGTPRLFVRTLLLQTGKLLVLTLLAALIVRQGRDVALALLAGLSVLPLAITAAALLPPPAATKGSCR